jgi:hemerythrin-like metal-binding protein
MADWVQWTPDLTVHVEKIDQQHMELIRQVNLLGEAVWDGKGKAAIGEILRFLLQYTSDHFRMEEELMRIHGYPKYSLHKQIHDDFVKEVQSRVEDFESGEVDSALVISVVNRVGEWIRGHIRVLDVELGRYLKNRGIHP